MRRSRAAARGRGPPVIGRTVDFTLGAQACSGITNASGVASCTVAVSSPLGTSIPITANFAGDAFYLPSSDTATAIVFAFPSKGAFVLGDTTATSAGRCSGGAAQWSKTNVADRRRSALGIQGLCRERDAADEHAAGGVRRAVDQRPGQQRRAARHGARPTWVCSCRAASPSRAPHLEQHDQHRGGRRLSLAMRRIPARPARGR